MKQFPHKQHICKNKKEEVKCTGKPQVYVAGSLFSFGDRAAQSAIAQVLEDAGYSTFLPQRDGLELANLVEQLMAEGNTAEEAAILASQIIFDVDVSEIFDSDALLSNGGGIEPDSGTVSETALGNSFGKAVVIFTDDIRTFSSGAILNPLYSNLATVPLVTSIENIPKAMKKAIKISNAENTQLPLKNLTKSLQQSIKNGRIARVKYLLN